MLLIMVVMDLFLPKVNSISLSSENKLGYVVDLIKNQYVDEVNIDSLQDEAIRKEKIIKYDRLIIAQRKQKINRQFS